MAKGRNLKLNIANEIGMDANMNIGWIRYRKDGRPFMSRVDRLTFAQLNDLLEEYGIEVPLKEEEPNG